MKQEEFKKVFIENMNIGDAKSADVVHKSVNASMKVVDPAIRITSGLTFFRRLWNIIKNPFTYLYNGTIEW